MTNDNSANNPVPNFYRASAEDFKKIPGSPIAYWVSERMGMIFEKSDSLDMHAKAKSGQNTGDNERFIRQWFEISLQRIGFGYKKRPIYWLFTSGKGRGFNALVYMHRYNRETLAKMRTDYLLELEAKLDARIGMLGDESAAEKGRLGKQVKELEKYDAVLHNKSLEYIDIDLDDGVKVNYAKFEGLVGQI